MSISDIILGSSIGIAISDPDYIKDNKPVIVEEVK